MKFASVSFLIALNFGIAISGFVESNVINDNTIGNNRQKLSTPEECARPCVAGEKPKTCYYHFTIEYFATLTRACQLCHLNTTTRLTPDCQCITSDGYETSGIITANRMYPGPSLMLCLHDDVVVDVLNRLPGNGVTVHWHGMFQKDYQYYDGVPFVTQCPIPEGSTFRYQWKAKNPGTHFWHSHSGLQKGNGLDGALIVREPKSTEVNSHLWDHDEIDNLIFITDLFHDSAEKHFPGTVVRGRGQEPDNFLINGLGQWIDPATGMRTTTPLATIEVKAGRRYRFRMVNSCAFMCPSQLTIEGHNLTIIASDGIPIEPVVVTSITSFSAERYDFILETDKTPRQYWIQLRGLGFCTRSKLQQFAILNYESAIERIDLDKRPTYDNGVDPGIILNPLNVRCNGVTDVDKFVCINQLKNALDVPRGILKNQPDVRMHLPFAFYEYSLEDVFEPGTYKKFLATATQVVATIGNISNMLPSSPLLSQRNSTPNDQICLNGKMPERCEHGKPCVCSHVRKIPLNSIVELILVDEVHAAGVSHPFHMHGHMFYIVGEGNAADHNVTTMNLKKVKELDEKGMIKRNLQRPPAKDTYAVPNRGYSIIRFFAQNPGYWLFHCHFLYHLEIGMSLVFQVGEPSDLPPMPEGFPQCGNFVPPIKFS